MSYVRRAFGLFAMACFVTCAHRPAVNSYDQFVLDSQTEHFEARIGPNGIEGPMIHIIRDGDSLKGNAFNHAVFLHWSADRASGLLGGVPIELTVQQEGDQVRARGLYAGSPVDLTFSSKGIDGILSGCSYWLKGSPGELQGFRQCGRRMQESMSVYLPQTLQSAPDPEKMGVLTLLLAP